MSLRTEVPRLRSLPWFTTWLWRPSMRRRRCPVDDGLPLRRPILRKYFLALFAAVVVPLLINGASEAWFGYQDQRTMLDARLLVEASAAAARIQGFSMAYGARCNGPSSCRGPMSAWRITASMRCGCFAKSQQSPTSP